MLKHVLVVDPTPARVRVREIRASLKGVARVTTATGFQRARGRLRTERPDLVVTNVCLEAYNGIHLALLADPARTRVIVYADEHDASLARDVQAAGAFYERRPRLTAAVPAYLHATLPAMDRRNPAVADRRQTSRNGRRATDRRGISYTLHSIPADDRVHPR